MQSFVIPYEEEDGDNKEETYDDVDSFDSPNVTLHQDTSLSLGEEEEGSEQSREGIYEVLEGEQAYEHMKLPYTNSVHRSI